MNARRLLVLMLVFTAALASIGTSEMDSEDLPPPRTVRVEERRMFTLNGPTGGTLAVRVCTRGRVLTSLIGSEPSLTIEAEHLGALTLTVAPRSPEGESEQLRRLAAGTSASTEFELAVPPNAVDWCSDFFEIRAPGGTAETVRVVLRAHATFARDPAEIRFE